MYAGKWHYASVFLDFLCKDTIKSTDKLNMDYVLYNLMVDYIIFFNKYLFCLIKVI